MGIFYVMLLEIILKKYLPHTWLKNKPLVKLEKINEIFLAKTLVDMKIYSIFATAIKQRFGSSVG